MSLCTMLPKYIFILLFMLLPTALSLLMASEVFLQSVKEKIPYEINKSRLLELKDGKILKIEVPVEDGPWPYLHLFALRSYSSKEAVATFTDFERQRFYIPGMLKSEVKRITDEKEVQVFYEVHVPWPLSNALYESTHKIQYIPKLNKYEVTWNQIKSNTTLKSEGKIEFIEVNGLILIHYANYVRPKSILAKIFKSKAMSDMEKSFLATLEEIERVKIQNTALREKQLKKLENLAIQVPRVP